MCTLIRDIDKMDNGPKKSQLRHALYVLLNIKGECSNNIGPSPFSVLKQLGINQENDSLVFAIKKMYEFAVSIDRKEEYLKELREHNLLWIVA